MLTVAELIKKGADYLEDRSSTPRLDAEVLLRFILGFNSTQLVIERSTGVSAEACAEFLKLIERRRVGEPVAYLVGTKEFFGREFKVDKHTLVPRPESEHLVEEILKFVTQARLGDISILDLGTGSGILLITLVRELTDRGINVRGVGVDISAEALTVAKENADKICPRDSVAFRYGSWWQPIQAEERFNVIVTNPPYISIHDKNVSPETAFEPQRALYSGVDGLDDYRTIVSEVSKHLEPKGIFCGEFGYTQAKAIKEIISSACSNLSLSVIKDMAGHDRLFKAEAAKSN